MIIFEIKTFFLLIFFFFFGFFIDNTFFFTLLWLLTILCIISLIFTEHVIFNIWSGIFSIYSMGFSWWLIISISRIFLMVFIVVIFMLKMLISSNWISIMIRRCIIFLTNLNPMINLMIRRRIFVLNWIFFLLNFNSFRCYIIKTTWLYNGYFSIW